MNILVDFTHVTCEWSSLATKVNYDNISGPITARPISVCSLCACNLYHNSCANDYDKKKSSLFCKLKLDSKANLYVSACAFGAS